MKIGRKEMPINLVPRAWVVLSGPGGLRPFGMGELPPGGHLGLHLYQKMDR